MIRLSEVERALLAVLAVAMSAGVAHAVAPVTDLRLASTITLQWTVPATVANRGCDGDSLARSWSTAFVYVQPRKVPSVPGLLWPLQVPVLVDSLPPMQPGSAATLVVPERPAGDTYLVRSRSVAGWSCWSNPIAGWTE